jgi:hypothetical protein
LRESVAKRLGGTKFRELFTEESLQAAINAVKALDAKPIEEEEEKPSTVEEPSDTEIASALNNFGSLEDKLEAMLEAKLAAMLAAK